MDVVGGTAAFLALLACGAVYVGLFLGLTVLTAYNFHYELPHSTFVLRILRSVATLSTTILYLPLSSIMLRGLSCPSHHNTWMGTGIECNSAGRIVIAIFLAVLLVGFALMSLTVSTVYLDRDPASPSWVAKTTGRVDAGILLAKLVLAFVYNVLDEQLVGSVVLTVVLIAFGVAVMWAYIVYQPHIHAWVNAFQAGLWAVFTTSAVSLGAAQIAGVQNTVLLLYVCSPVAFVAALMVSLMHSSAVAQTPVDQLRSPFDVAVWCNHRMQLYAAFYAVADRGGSAAAKMAGDDEDWNNDEGDEAADAARASDETSDSDEDAAAGRNDSSSETAEGKQRRLMTQLAGHHASLGMPLQSADYLSIDELEAEKDRLLQSARVGYEHCIEHFSTSEVSAVMASAFYRHHYVFFTQECLCLHKALRRNPSFDTRFYIYSRLRRLNESDGSGLGPIERIMFDQEYKYSAQLRIEAYRLLQQLWEIMSEGTPDLVAVEVTGVALYDTLTRIEEAFSKLLDLNPTSTKTLRAYAYHLIDLKNLPAKATELLNRAERLDETGLRNRMRYIKNVRFGDSTKNVSFLNDNAAIVSISGASHNLGEILAVSTAACRMFGFTKSGFVGQNVRVIVPPPLKQQHDNLLLRFRQKRKSMVVGHQRLLFAQTRDGSIIPIWLVVRESPPDRETSEPRFTATLDPVNTHEAFMFVGDASSNYRMYAASARALELLGLEGEMLNSEHVSAANFFPTVSSEYNGGDIRLTKDELQAISRQSGVSDLRDLLRRRKDKAPPRKGKTSSSEKDASSAHKEKGGSHAVQTQEAGDDKDAGTKYSDSRKTHRGGAAAAAASSDSAGKAMPSPGKRGAHSDLEGGSGSTDYPRRKSTKGWSKLREVANRAVGGQLTDRSGSFTNLVAAMEEAKAIRSQMYARRRSMQSMAADGSGAIGGTSRIAGGSSGKVRTGVRGGVTATVPNLLKLKTPGIIPMQNTGDGDKIAVGVSQKVVLRAIPVFYLVRLNIIETSSFGIEEGFGGAESEDVSDSGSGYGSSGSDQSSTRYEGSRPNGQARRPFSRTGTYSTGFTETQPEPFKSRDADAHDEFPHDSERKSKQKRGRKGGHETEGSRNGRNRTVKELKEQVMLPPPHYDGILPSKSVLRGLRGAMGSDGEGKDSDRVDSTGAAADDDLLADLEGSQEAAVGKGEAAPVLEAVRGASVQPYATGFGSEGGAPGSADRVEETMPRVDPGRESDEDDKQLLAPSSEAAPPRGGVQMSDMEVRPNRRGGSSSRRSSSGRRGRSSTRRRGSIKSGRGPPGSSQRGSSPQKGGRRQSADSFYQAGTLQRHMTHTGHTIVPASAPGGQKPGRAASVGSSGSSASSYLSRALSYLKDMAEPEVWRIRNLLLMLIVMAVAFATIAVVWMGEKMTRLEQAKRAIWLVGHRTGAYYLARGEITAAVVDTESIAVSRAYREGLDALNAEDFTLSAAIEVAKVAEASLNSSTTSAAGYENQTAVLVADLVDVRAAAADATHVLEQYEHVDQGIRDAIGSTVKAGAALQLAIEQLQAANTEIQDLNFKKSGYEFETGELDFWVTLPDLDAFGHGDTEDPYGNDATSGDVGSSLELPLVQEIEEAVSTIQRIARLGLTNITTSTGDVRTLRYNSVRLMDRMQRASNLWQQDYVDYMKQTLLEISIVGGVLLLTLLIVAFFCFVQTARSLGARATTVLEAFMVIPQPVAQAMRGRSGLMLEKVLAEADAAETAEDGYEMGEMDNGDDEEEAERRLIMNEADGDTVSDGGGPGAGGASGFGGVLRAASRRNMGQQDGEKNRVKIVSIGEALKTKAVRYNQDHTSGMTRRRLLYSDREITLRPYRNSSSFVQRTVLWLLLPVMLVLFHLLFVVTLQLLQSYSLSSIGERIMAVYLSRKHVNQYVNDLLDLSIQKNTSSWQASVVHLEYDEVAMLETAALVVFGGQVSKDETGSNLDVSKLDADDSSTPEGQVRLIYEEDVCLSSKYAPITTAGLVPLESDDALANEARCRAVQGGVLSEGILSAVSSLLNHGRLVVYNAPTSEQEARQRLARHSMPNANSTELTYLLASSPALAEEVVVALSIEHPFMKLGASVAATLLADLIDDELARDRNLLNVVSWSFVGVFAIVLIAFYYPYVTELGVPLRSARHLLSLLPGELVTTLPDLRATIQDIATDAQLASHGSASTRSRGQSSSRSTDESKGNTKEKGDMDGNESDDKSTASGYRYGPRSSRRGDAYDSKGSHFNFDVAMPSKSHSTAPGPLGQMKSAAVSVGVSDHTGSGIEASRGSSRRPSRPSQVHPEDDPLLEGR